MLKRIRTIITVVALFILSLAFVSCKSTCKVSFYVDDSLLYEEQVEVGKTYSSLIETKDYKKVGYNFTGWYTTDEIEVTNATIIKSDVKLYAKYDKIQYTIRFFEGEILRQTKQFSYNDPLEVIDGREKEGYTFVGWFSKNDVEYSSGNKVVDSLDLYAKYTIRKSFKITYNLGKEKYLNKNALFTSFFTDFYNFILTTYPSNSLDDNGITSLSGFLNLASSWTYGSSNNMTGIGNVASTYFLSRVKDGSGSLATQPDTHFIGYCVKNHMYETFLPFLVDFFGEWRRSEGYTTDTNHGSDFFYEAWAPLVDTGKFFYFNSTTVPQYHNETIKNNLDHVPGVCETKIRVNSFYENEIVSLPKTLICEGYTFLGWYKDLNNSSSLITTTEGLNEDVLVFAKWNTR